MSAVSVCKVGMYWERPQAPRMFGPSATLTAKGQPPIEELKISPKVIPYTNDNETVLFRTEKKSRLYCFKVRRNY